MSNVLELVNIRKSFGTELVLNDLSLAVPEHTATALIGASGSGKSTLLRCINLLESIDDGQIFLDGDEISDPLINVDDVRRRLGMVFQSFNLFPHKTVLENITLSPIKVHGKSKDEANAHAIHLLKRFDLADKADQYPDRLSGGQQQRGPDAATENARYCKPNRPALGADQFATIAPHARERPGPEGHGAGGVRRYRGHAQRQQRGEREQRAAAGDRVDGAAHRRDGRDDGELRNGRVGQQHYRRISGASASKPSSPRLRRSRSG